MQYINRHRAASFIVCSMTRSRDQLLNIGSFAMFINNHMKVKVKCWCGKWHWCQQWWLQCTRKRIENDNHDLSDVFCNIFIGIFIHYVRVLRYIILGIWTNTILFRFNTSVRTIFSLYVCMDEIHVEYLWSMFVYYISSLFIHCGSVFNRNSIP